MKFQADRGRWFAVSAGEIGCPGLAEPEIQLESLPRGITEKLPVQKPVNKVNRQAALQEPLAGRSE